MKLQTGNVVARIEKSRAGDRDLMWASNGLSSDWPAFVEPLATAQGALAGSSSGCSLNIGRDSENPREDQIRAWGVCLRQAISPALLAIQAMNYWKTYRLPDGIQNLSQLSDRDLQLFLMTQFKKLEMIVGADPEIEPLLKLQRNKFSDADLDELLALVKRRDHALMAAEKKISGWFRAVNFKDTVHLAVKSWDRYRALEMLVTESTYSASGSVDRSGLTAFNNLTPLLLGNKSIAAQLKNSGLLTASDTFHDQASQALPLYNLHPYALLAFIPRAGEENTHLRGNSQNPLFVIRDFQGELGDFSGNLKEVNPILTTTLTNYKKYRDQDLKQTLSLQNQNPFPSEAVKVAFIDTGMDYLQYPELAPFLSKGSQDYADLDESPYLPAISLLDHGTATAASLLTVLSQKAPDLLKARGIELAMWKLSSLRSLLSGPLDSELWRWNPRHTVGFFDLLLDQYKKLKDPVFLPKIASFSASFQSHYFLANPDRQKILKEIPWLWVMAAGNENANIDQSKTACFQDIPESHRGQDRIVCVGALVKRQGVPKIAQYSNFGNAITVYAYESYERLCPSGTSCATPAITAAATLIASKFPSLTPSEIKQVIIESSVEKNLEVDLNAREIMKLARSGQAIPRRTVKVFDPLTQMEAAIQVAERKAQSMKDFR